MQHLKTLLLAALVATTAPAMAHGNEAHVKPVALTKKEQKAWGIAGDAKAARRTIDIRMLDGMRFEPSLIEVREGETIRLRMTNAGAMQHELVVGTKRELDEHAALMVRFPDMEHDEPYMAHVGPGKTGEIVWTFNRAGEFDFACLIAGHYQSGMVGKVKVLPAAAVRKS